MMDWAVFAQPRHYQTMQWVRQAARVFPVCRAHRRCQAARVAQADPAPLLGQQGLVRQVRPPAQACLGGRVGH